MKMHRRRITSVLIIALLVIALLILKLNMATKSPNREPETERRRLHAEADKACAEAERRHVILDRRFPNPDSVSADEYFKSVEYLDAASSDQACETAKANLEEE